MKIISWNVNGLQGILKKSIDNKKTTKITNENPLSCLIEKENPDILCLQEIRCSETFNCSPYLFSHVYMNCAQSKKGYSGTLVCSKIQPLSIKYNFEDFKEETELDSELTTEGRLMTLEYGNFYLINVYSPNSKPDLSRLDFRINVWEKTLRNYVKMLQSKKRVILVGDLNCISNDLDIYNPDLNWAGTTMEEKAAFKVLLQEADMVDTFRELHPKSKKYSWSSPWLRKQNQGCRLDFFLASSQLKSQIKNADILSYEGSDHRPIVLEIDLPAKIKIQRKTVINEIQ